MIHPTTRVLAAELPGHVGESVEISGWLHRRRALKSVTFLVIRDRSGPAQVVATGAGPDLPEETVLRIRGTVTANPQAPAGVELTSPTVEVLSSLAEAPPFSLFRPTVEAALPVILDGLGFTEIQTPKVVSSATESGADVFALDWFGRPAYLAQSPQFFKQAMVGVFERVYETGPVFRAEPHDTARHLAQYTSLDAELGFITDHREVMAVLREVVAGMVASVAERAGAAVDLLEVKPPEVPAEIPQLHFAEAMRLLGVDEPDLAPAHERWLSEWALREHGSEFLFVVGYPMRKRPFYTHPEPGRPEYSNSFDLLFRGLELVTGGQRLHRYEDYLAALAARGEPVQPYEGYLRSFAHGMPPHGGFALGLERWTARLTGTDNIRRTTLFPRDLHRLTP
ncbi:MULTISPECIES: aspartate--tRNA(Asn) ligase [unclassified Kitasatospora]|uniref:aspartate--tRNA(Asn) ligase n=1 Tax=unclassified Kitasatospora TaxID=2633591 RepID=UPI00381CAEA1